MNGCYECSKQCIDVQFCNGSSSFSRNIRISITANPEFWGFGGVLISGWATYSQSYYDFFDGFDRDYVTGVPCVSNIADLESVTASRPDVFYRSVYDPDTGSVLHYDASGNIEDSGIGRGGAEVYLIDRQKWLIKSGVLEDGNPCEVSPPEIFAEMPDNFGWGNKILFNSNIYRNLSGAWRLTSIENCYEEDEIFIPSGYLIGCDSLPKQNILYQKNKFQKYDYSRIKATGDSSYFNYSSECLPDGAAAGKYMGYFSEASSIYRSIGISEFVQARLSYGSPYNPGPVSALKNGMTIGIKNDVSGIFNNVYTVFDVDHQSTYTNVKFVGTSTGNLQYTPGVFLPTGDFQLGIGLSGHWIAFNTIDPQTCCGLSTYGVSDENKNISFGKNYHTDFRRVFNNPKNILQSNRERKWRYDYGLFEDPLQPISMMSSGRYDCTYPSITGIDISGNTYGYPLLNQMGSLLAATGSLLINANPTFDRYLPYYGPFYETDLYDNMERFEQKINRGIGKNKTCYSKHATLEIFPDCLTQYDYYTSCSDGGQYDINKVSRLAFVYRGCDFNDECFFDSSGLPIGAWENQGGQPQNINDLKRLLAGQEIHMFLNLSSAWGGRIPGGSIPCDCDNPEQGTLPPKHVTIHTPATFSNFLNFDLDPTGYGCKDPRHQISQLVNRQLQNVPQNTAFCDPLHTTPYACLPRQPYPTYGYMINLCGKETNDRKEVIKQAFSKLHQEKIYTNENPSAEILEPMYWNVVAPNPAPYTGNGYWGSGTISSLDSEGNPIGGTFQQIGGSGYGFWGVADINNQVVAPYFCTKNGENISCNTVHTNYVDFSVTGTFANVLNTSNGWPTEKVPFLIEIETGEGCVGCAVSQMKRQNLVLELEGLNTEYIFDARNGFVKLGKYGHNYCKYGPTITDAAGGGKTYMGVKPNFTCSDGWDTDICNGSGNIGNEVWYANTGNTCSCVNGQSVTLYPVPLSGTDNMTLGWTSNPLGGAAGLIEIEGCSDLSSSYFDVAYDEKAGGGYRILAEFELTCPAMHPFLTTAEYPDALYEGDTLTTLYGAGCPNYYPANMGSNLELHTTLYMIADSHLATFRRLSEFALKRLPGMGLLANGVIYPPDAQNFWGNQETNYFGTCPGDKVYAWGCKPEGTYFYGCSDGAGRYSNYQICENTTLCDTCPVGDGPGEITCVCDIPVGYEGIIPRPPPINYQFNECDCLCTEPHLIGVYTINDDNSGMTPISGEYLDCAVVYWYSTDGMEPIVAVQGPPYPYMGLVLPKITSSVDWFDWSHGVNSISEGITHELYKPYLGNQYLPSQSECPQLTIDISTEIGNVIDCEENTECTYDNNANIKTCGSLIYTDGSSGVKVRKKKCHPEVAIVNKIECLNGFYKLYISREYHEHDRQWSEKLIVKEDGEDVDKCIAVNAGAYIYDDGEVTGCVILPYSTLADTVTPVTNAPCSIHPSSGLYVNQNYKYSLSGDFPSGDYTWNYFNIFYRDNYLPTINNGFLIPSLGFDESGIYNCDTGIYPPTMIVNNSSIFPSLNYDNPANFKGIFATIGTHSCVQDSVECGGELWCNKLFFPRHSYKAGTKIAKFGASQICTGSNKIQVFPILDGYYEASGNFSDIYIPTAKPLIKEAESRFVDWCNDSLIQESLYDIGIDDNYLVVRDYLPLIGVVHPGWRFTVDVKSCTVINSGCQDQIPTHTDSTILAGIYKPQTWKDNKFDSMGYYLDRFKVTYDGNTNLIGASGIDQCLFNPFKIHIDVECSTNRIARRDYPTDSPTYLQGVQFWDARTCQGIYRPPNCSCAGTQCKYATKQKTGTCTLFKLAEYDGTISSDDDGECFQIGEPVTQWYHPAVLGGGPPTLRPCNGQGTIDGNWQQGTCGEGVYYRISNAQSYVRLWQCNNNQYLHKHPGEFIVYPTGECDCKSQVVDGLCNATYSCTNYSSCECNPIGSGNSLVQALSLGEASGQWWADDCECMKYPQDDFGALYCTPSVVKFTITEE